VPTLYLIRHGQIAPGGGEDPALSDQGRAQAEALAQNLAPQGPLPILCSPYRRTRQTAAALARIWKVSPRSDPRIGELPLPPGSPIRKHAEWIKYARARRWSELDPPLHRWRLEVLRALLELGDDTAVVSHFVALNVAVGHALHDDRVTCFEPENCSCTIMDSDGKNLRVVELGAQATK
jgi:broad specificity phosphatase PhoE